MRVMKDSGIEWIGEIPEEWALRRLKFALSTHSGGVWGKSKGECGLDCICIRVADFDYLHLSVNFTEEMTLRSYPQKKIDQSKICNGDILLEKSGGGEQTPVGRSVLFKNDDTMMCANFIESLRPNSSYNSSFLAYWLNAAYRNGYSKRNIKQTTGIQNLDIPAFLSETIIDTSLSEQARIVLYLDAKCAEIDALIAAKEKTNALLKERRQSVIYEAVTKGLDPNAPMKDSGIEWIGEIPVGWDTKKIKTLFNIASGATPKSANGDYWDGDIAWITPADYKTEDVYVSCGRKSITEQGMKSCATSLIPSGSIIFSKRAPVGLVVISTSPLCTNQGCLSCIPQKQTNAKFYYYAMSVFTEQFDLYASGTTFKEISTETFANFKLPFPCTEDQAHIAEFLDTKCAEIDDLISANETTIEKSKEYRQSVIFEAVTGKVEV